MEQKVIARPYVYLPNVEDYDLKGSTVVRKFAKVCAEVKSGRQRKKARKAARKAQ